MHETVDHPVRSAIDFSAIMVTVGTVIGWLPSVAALLTIIWTAIRIYESDTVQRFLGKKGGKKSE